MILDAIYGAFAALIIALFESVSFTFTLPAAWASGYAFWVDAWTYAEDMQMWIPIGTIKWVLAGFISLQLAIIAIRIARLSLSLFTGGGGNLS